MRLMGNIILIGGLVFAFATMGWCSGTNEEKGLTRTVGLTSNRGFANKCELGAYAALCWTLAIRNQHVSLSGSIDNPLISVPSGGKPGTVSGINVRGRYSADVRMRVSPLLAFGVPSFACAAASPVDGPKVGTAVVTFGITGNVQWRWGSGYISTSGIREDNAVITASNLSLSQFDLHNFGSKIDRILRSAFRNTVLREADRQIVNKMNQVFALGDAVKPGLPVFAPGENPHASGGFCSG